MSTWKGNGDVRVEYGENNVNVGPLKDIPEICVDHFFGSDLKSSTFFLSHAHTDHMVGLESSDFLSRLSDPGVKLYCHTLTPILLGAFARYLGGQNGLQDLIRRGKLVPLDADHPYKIQVPRSLENLEVTVTLLPAGHCPGSVMFLFETESLRILHTGDFRLTRTDLERMKHLHVDGKPKRVDHLYVDTTFCTRNASQFPERKEVVQRALKHVRDWTSLSTSNWVFIKFAAKFAHEYILLELSKTFGAKIHVTPERKEIYANIPGLSEVVTLDSQTPFHLCGNRRCMEDGESLELRLTSMWYTMQAESKSSDVIVRTQRRLSVCYSMHSSLHEIAQTIDYLRPSVVTPLVQPFRSSMEQVKESLRELCSVSFTFEDYRSLDWTHISHLHPNQELDGLAVAIFDEPEATQVEEEKQPYDSQFQWNFQLSGSPQKKSESQSSGSQPNSQEERLLQMSPCPRQSMPQGLKILLSGACKRANDSPPNTYKSKRKLICYDTSCSSDATTGSQEETFTLTDCDRIDVDVKRRQREGSGSESDSSQSLLTGLVQL